MVDNNKTNRTLEKQQNKVIGLIDKVLGDLSQEICGYAFIPLSWNLKPKVLSPAVSRW